MLTFNYTSSKDAARSEKMKRRKSWIKSRSKKFLALYYWGKFLGINPLSLSEKNRLQYSYSSVFYACFLIVMYCYTYYGLLMSRSTILLPDETPVAYIVDFLAISWEFLVTSSTWFVFAIHQDRIKTIVKCFVTAEKTLKKLGISDDWNEQFKEFGIHLLVNNILFLVSSLVSHGMWSFYDNYDVLVWTKFDIPQIAPFNVGIIFTWCLILVRRKFHRLNETVEFLMEHRCNDRNEADQMLIGQSSRDFHLLLDKINLLSRLHRELRDIIYHLEEHFASFVLFSVGNSITYLTLNIYRICRYLKAHPTQTMTLTYFGALSHWMLYPAIFLIVISNFCGSTSVEANNTGSMLQKGLNRCKHLHEIREDVKFNSLALDLFQNRLSMSVFGLFKLDHFFVYRTVAASTTYLIIMLQLNI